MYTNMFTVINDLILSNFVSYFVYFCFVFCIFYYHPFDTGFGTVLEMG